MSVVVAVGLPASSQGSPRYRFCAAGAGATTYLLSRGHVSCGQARSLERVAFRQRVVPGGPRQTAGWWSGNGGRWQTSALGKQTSGAYRGTWMYGIWSAQDGVDTCPAVYFFLRHRLRTVSG